MKLLFLTSNFDYGPGITQVLSTGTDQTMPFLLWKNIINEQNIRTDLNTKTSVICGINSTPYMMHYHSGQDGAHCLPRSVHCDFHHVAIILHHKKDIFYNLTFQHCFAVFEFMGQSLYKKLNCLNYKYKHLNNLETLVFIAGCVTSINMTQTTDNVYHTQVKTKTQQLHALSNLVSTLRTNALNKVCILHRSPSNLQHTIA